MHFLGFHSFAEFNVYLTFVLLGMSIMLVVSAITSAPTFVSEFYIFATGKPDAECETPMFWNNANTFFNVGTYVTQLSCEALTLTPVFRRIPLRVRMLVSLVLPFAELFLLVVVPVVTVPTQDGAIAVLMVVAVMGGFSKALCDSTTNALVGPFPTKFMNGELWGLTVISLVMSVIQIALKASMGTSFRDVLTQSHVYFGIAIGLQFLTIVEFLLMFRNPFAMQYVAEFRQLARKGGGAVAAAEAAAHTMVCTEPADASDGDQVRVVELQQVDPAVAGLGGNVHEKCVADNEDDDHVRRVSLDSNGNFVSRPHEDVSESEGGNAAVLRAAGDADKMRDVDQTGTLTSTDQMVATRLWPVVKKIWPMLFTCFFVYFTSLSLFPGVFFAVDRDGVWFSTIIVLLFNTGDFLARLVLMVRPLRPRPMACLIGCFCRLAAIPFLALCVRGIIHGVWLPYILIFLLGFSNGFFGAMAMIHCPRTTTLKTAGERALAAVTAGVTLQCGLAFGSNLALAINLLL